MRTEPDTSGVRWLAGIGIGLVALAGCGGGSQSLPAACIAGPGPVMKALARAPGPVAINGTPISRCFNRNASGDDVQIVGTNLLTAAEQLGDRARRGDAQAALRLGYLVGAAQRGVRRSGIGTEIVRRIDAETSGLGGGMAAYERGHRAGLAQG
jgi:hypothetical protein